MRNLKRICANCRNEFSLFAAKLTKHNNLKNTLNGCCYDIAYIDDTWHKEATMFTFLFEGNVKNNIFLANYGKAIPLCRQGLNIRFKLSTTFNNLPEKNVKKWNSKGLPTDTRQINSNFLFGSGNLKWNKFRFGLNPKKLIQNSRFIAYQNSFAQLVNASLVFLSSLVPTSVSAVFRPRRFRREIEIVTLYHQSLFDQRQTVADVPVILLHASTKTIIYKLTEC